MHGQCPPWQRRLLQRLRLPRVEARSSERLWMKRARRREERGKKGGRREERIWCVLFVLTAVQVDPNPD